MTIQYSEGEWTSVEGVSHFLIMNGDDAICKTSTKSYRDKCNAALICDAVNNTAGQGIDPNSVPTLLQATKDLLGFIVSLQMLGQLKGCEDDAAEQVANALNAINSAKLK